MVDLVVLSLAVFAFALVSRRVERTTLTAPLVFVVAGATLGPEGLGLVTLGLDDHTVLLLGEIALAIVLFTAAASINLSSLRRNEGLPSSLLCVGMPLTIALGAAAAVLLLTDLNFWEAAIVGTVLAPTDAALGQAAPFAEAFARRVDEMPLDGPEKGGRIDVPTRNGSLPSSDPKGG